MRAKVMLMSLPRFCVAAFVVAAFVVAHTTAMATDVYKCTAPNGDVAFQDHPCPVSASEQSVHLPDAPPPAALPPAPPTESIAETVAPPPPKPAPAVPLPALWQCENAEDGSRYFSENGSPPVRYVPLGTLGYPGKSLAQAYGPGGGSGISAPGVNKIPISTSPRDAAAAQFTALQDVCIPATREQTCGYLQKQYDEIEHKLKRAFKDERAILEPKAEQLETQLSGC